MNELVKNEWYAELIEDCKTIIVERIFNAANEYITCWHEVGARILAENDNFERQKIYGQKIAQSIAESLGKSERTINYAIRFAKDYPDLQKFLNSNGKDLNWFKITQKYLPTPQLKQEIPQFPKGKYSVIYADPPWDIGSQVLDKWGSPLEDKYPTMSLEELKNLGIQELSGEDCVCFLWVTLTTLPNGLELLDSWGFKYHICITWDKGSGWSSTGFHRRTELCLVGYKGKITNVIKQEGEYIPTLIVEQKTTHSTKPNKMYELIENRTIGTKIELFARNKRQSWDSWGNEDGDN